MSRVIFVVVVFVVVVFVAANLVADLPAQWKPPAATAIRPPALAAGKLVSCTPSELAALRKAYAKGAAPIVKRVRAAERSRKLPIRFPPRGGQHNQWYQCDACQFALQTIDPTHHRCDKCQKVYSGTPYNDVVFSRVHSRNWAGARDAAWAFALTKDRGFAEHTSRVLIGYADRYETYPYHTASRARRGTSGGHLMEQTLTEAGMMIGTILPSFDLVRSTLSAPQRKHVEDHLLRPMLRNIAKCQRGKSNWQSFHNAAMFIGGALIGDASYMRRAILDPKNGFVTQMRISVSSDGMWYENSWGYHFYTLRALVATAEGARRCGIDLWGHPTLRRMLTVPAQYSMAGGRLPRFGDDVNSSLRGVGYLFEAAYAATGDAALAGVLPAAASWESILAARTPSRVAPPSLSSVVFRGAGHAILRSRGPGELAVALTFGPFGGFHGHFDKLSFVWFGFGEELGVDPGRAKSQAYRLPIHKNWYRGTIAHNTVVVDGKPQRGVAGELVHFADSDRFVTAVARCTKAYDGVDHRRCIVLTNDYLVVLDRLVSDQARRFTWLYHNRGQSVACPSAGDAPRKLDLVGGEFIDVQGSGHTAGPIHATLTGTTTTVTLLLAADGKTTVHRGTGVGATVLDRVPLVIAERRGKRVEFAAAMTAHAAAQRTLVTGIRTRRDGATTTVEITTETTAKITAGKRIDRIHWDGGKTVRFEPAR